MKQLYYLIPLMVLSSSAYAGHSYSFVFHGKRVHIEASRHCRSLSCVSVSYPGKRDRSNDTDTTATTASPAKPVPEQAAVTPAGPPAANLAAAPAVTPPTPPVAVRPAQPEIPKIDLPPSTATVPSARTAPAPVLNDRPGEIARPGEPPKELRVMNDEPDNTPLGDWQTEGKKGSVHIEKCGTALCGYVVDSSTRANGEAILINMKPKVALEWTGSIYGRDSGETYYATMAMKGPNSLRVEACALGHFFCSGNVWSRIATTPDRMISARQPPVAPPRS
jgi:hypothetical protein